MREEGEKAGIVALIYGRELTRGRMSLSQGRLATCLDNVTESGSEVKGYVCQSTAVPSDIRSQSLVSTQPVLIGDSLIGTDGTFFLKPMPLMECL